MAPSPLDDYHLERRLGTGRLGELWLARRPEGRDAFQVRRLPGFLTEDQAATERFLGELRLLGLLRHPNLARLVDAGWSEGACLVVTEYVEGIPLADCLRADRGPLPVPLAVELVAQAGEALAYAHTAPGPDGRPLDRVHGELSPERLVFDDAGLVRVLDFGLSRAACALTAQRVGPAPRGACATSPRAASGRHVGPRSDVYALGAVLYSLRPGAARIALSTGRARLRSPEGLPLWRTAARVPEPVREAIRRATSRDPRRRFRA
jgi:serine/threonine-protein kinase